MMLRLALSISITTPAVGETVSVVTLGTDIRTTTDLAYDAPATPVFASTIVQGVAVDSQDQKIYWTETGTTRILRANLDGSGTEILHSALSGPVGLALDVSGGKMYWADASANSVHRSNLDGSTPEAIVPGLGSPTGIALDLTANKVYWTELDTNVIGRANLDGSSAETFVPTTTGLNAAIAVNGVEGKVYWFDTGAATLRGLNTNGASPVDIDSTLTAVESLAVDENENQVFASTNDASPRILLYDRTSGVAITAATTAAAAPAIAVADNPRALWWSVPSMNALRVAPYATVDVVADLATNPGDIEIDTDNGKIYFTQWDGVAPPASLSRANDDGTSLEVLFPAETSAFGVALDTLAQKLYWSDPAQSRIYQSNLDGTGRVTILDGGLVNTPYGLALNTTAGKIYWANESAGQIGRADTDGSNPEIIITGLGSPYCVAVDSTSGKIFWTDRANDEVGRANLDGTGVEVIATTQDFPYDLEIDSFDSKLYWSQSASTLAPELRRANPDGSAAELVASTGLWPGAIALVTQQNPALQGSISSNIHPSNIHEGEHLVLTAPAGTGYQWRLNGGDIVGATAATLQFNPVDQADSGTYTVQYDNGLKTVVESLPFALNVQPPQILPLAGFVMVILSVLLLGIAFANPRRHRRSE